jgi:hypothetical protein
MGCRIWDKGGKMISPVGNPIIGTSQIDSMQTDGYIILQG